MRIEPTGKDTELLGRFNIKLEVISHHPGFLCGQGKLCQCFLVDAWIWFANPVFFFNENTVKERG